MKKLFNNIWFTIIFIIILSGLALGLALYDSFPTVITTLQQITLVQIILISFWSFMPRIVHGLILYKMAHHIQPNYKFKHGLMNSLIEGFGSGITPSSTGGQFMQTYAFNKHGLKSSQGAGIVWLDFFLYSLSVVLISVVFFLGQFTEFAHSSITLVFALGLFVNVLMLVLLGLMVYFPVIYRKFMHFFVHVLEKLRLVKQKDKLLDSWNETLDHFYEAQAAIKDNKGMLWQLFGLNILRIMIYFTTPIAIGLALNLKIEFSSLYELIALASFISIANTFVPLPGASGATESLFVLSFSTVIGKASAASIMILWRFFSFYLILILGGIMFFRVRHIKALKEENDEKAIVD